MILKLFVTDRQKTIYLWSRTVLWCGLIFLMSSIPDYSGQGLSFDDLSDVLHFLSRKAAHLTEYAVLMIFLYEAVRATWARRANLHFLVSFAGVLLYAASDEWHQTFVYGRTGTIFDVTVDITGAVIGYAVYKKWIRPILRHESAPEKDLRS